ncbi:MAG: PspC domain-containing protein [Candidatus Niyogibacteria bacterium]|nr:PspC domain-containing protein [Candidatus Niyogibacteria bacterium]
MERKKLYRSEKNKIISGIFGGVGEYFDIDPSLLRLFWVLVVVFTGLFPGIIAYATAVAVVPKKAHKLE